ncbi:MAG TPA: class I SAM-dependent methyltransferase [bacterium]|nr:class I SAM-dependent methyltransferase [bacterium]HPQ18547.1 class I SAM-dependent methyltransferase [bacterium]
MSDLQGIERSSLFSYSVQYFWYKKQKVLLDIVRKYLRSVQKKVYQICDIGCEIGHDVFKIYDIFKNKYSLFFTGIDINEKAIEIANARSNFNDRNPIKFVFYCFDIEKGLPIQNYYDIIIITELIEHLKEPEKIFNEIIRILSDDGIVILSTPNTENMSLLLLKKIGLKKIFNFDDYKQFHSQVGYDHISLFNEKELKRIIDKYNLKIIEKKRITFFYGNKLLDENPILFAFYLILDNIFDKIKILNSFSYSNFYVIKKR